MIRLLASLLLATSLPLMAQVYTYTDAQGNPVFTNEPPPEGVGAQPVNIPPTNSADVPAPGSYTAPPVNNPAPQQQPASQQQTSDTTYYTDDDDYERRRAAEAVRRNPVVDPVRVETPAVDAVVPGSGRIAEPGRAR
jgi:hypothetical protein